ncbi:MAG: hypothetical protein PHN19_03985 [Patescibacteria group bacterium]|nr:hypothetical protein [Patescibacteria group bacterium]
MKKIILLLFGIVFLCGLTVSFAKAEVIDEQPGDWIYYEKNGYIWVADLLTDMKFKLFKGHMPKLSVNKEKVAYYNGNMKPAIYNVLTGHHRAISSSIETANMQPIWSPSGKYIVFNGHTSTNNMFVVMTNKGKEKVTFEAIGDAYWVNDEVLAYTSMHSVPTLRPRGDGGGNGFGISKINVKTGKITVLQMPNDLTDYLLFDVLGGKIRYIKYVVESQAGWESGDWVLSYYRMNKYGKNLEVVKELVYWSERIKNVLSDRYENYMINDFGAYQSTKWRLFTMQKSLDSDIVVYTMHYPHKNTLSRILKGDYPTW